MATSPTPSERGNNIKKRARWPPDDPTGWVRTLPFEQRKRACLREMCNKQKEIFDYPRMGLHWILDRVNETIGATHKVKVDEVALTILEHHKRTYSAADADEYVRQVMISESVIIKDTVPTFEELLRNECENKYSMKPWDGLVVGEVPLEAVQAPIADPTTLVRVLSLYGSSGCGKSKALDAVAERIIKEHRFPNVFRLWLQWRPEDEEDLLKELRAAEVDAGPPSAPGGTNPTAIAVRPSDDDVDTKMEVMDAQRNCIAAEMLLDAFRSRLGRPFPPEAAPPDATTKFALVVTLDEVENVPTLARGLVSISRQLNGDDEAHAPPAVGMLRKVFGDVVIVLAGTTAQTLTGGAGSMDPSMVRAVNMDDVQWHDAAGKRMSREACRQALLRSHIWQVTHGQWYQCLSERLLQSRLRLALGNPRVVSLVANMTRLRRFCDVQTVRSANAPNPLSLQEFDQWALLLATQYCRLNGNMKDINPIAADPRAYSERQLVFLRAHYVWDHGAEMRRVLEGLLAKESTPGTAFSEEEGRLADLRRQGLVTLARDENAKGAAVSGSVPRPSYRVSIPPSLPYIALAVLDCTVGSWACVAMQSVGLRYAAAVAWKGCATVGDAVPGLHVAGGRCLRDRRIAVAAAGGGLVRGWCAVEAPCALHGLCDDGTREARFWTERVLPLLKDHSVVLVVSGSGSPWDCFALLRLEDNGGGARKTQGRGRSGGAAERRPRKSSAASLLVAALRMDAAAEGTTEVAGALRADVTPYHALLKRTFACYGEVVLGAAVCTRQPAPERESERVPGVVYASPVERVFAEL